MERERQQREGLAGRPGYTQHNTSWIKFRAAIDKCSKTRGFPMVLSVESCDDPAGCGAKTAIDPPPITLPPPDEPAGRLPWYHE